MPGDTTWHPAPSSSTKHLPLQIGKDPPLFSNKWSLKVLKGSSYRWAGTRSPCLAYCCGQTDPCPSLRQAVPGGPAGDGNVPAGLPALWDKGALLCVRVGEWRCLLGPVPRALHFCLQRSLQHPPIRPVSLQGSVSLWKGQWLLQSEWWWGGQGLLFCPCPSWVLFRLVWQSGEGSPEAEFAGSRALAGSLGLIHAKWQAGGPGQGPAGPGVHPAGRFRRCEQ